MVPPVEFLDTPVEPSIGKEMITTPEPPSPPLASPEVLRSAPPPPPPVLAKPSPGL